MTLKEYSFMRKSYPTSFKTKVVLDILKGDRLLNEVASSYEIHPSLATRWKNTFLENCHRSFDDSDVNKESNAIIKELRELTDDLYRQIGKLTSEREWLKKKYSAE
jgi:transposase-like protein